MADKNGIKITLPKGTLVYPALQRPDTKFDPLGAYKADVKLSKADAAPIQAKIQARAKAHTGKALKATENSCWKPEVDEDGNETGFIIFTIRVKNKTSKKDGKTWDRRPMLIGADKKPIDVNPWGGTVAKVQAETHEWEFGGKKGISLQPTVVQILELKTGTGKEADLSDFDEEEGYTGEEPDTSGFNDDGSENPPAETPNEDADY